ncbi:phytanoyl-CoA dioxygenase family protein [Sphingomonas fennica]|uniref:Phytanoyl-CoA dioxygenase n=1 Tax=Edaphosphingomonas fennica TaxID=114404 RepID=A0A2T4HLU7_9SPHN|nr:phytanoyl-CoA dioxygenase family protein [Sphingomonas fennica]PTD16759.1 phytanoyl-CoA dioxygenase [Sphingomonas fennica]
MKIASLLAPVQYMYWAAQLGTGAKSFLDNPLIGSSTLNHLGLHVGRMKLAHGLAWQRRRRLEKLVSEPDRTQFDAQGFVAIRNFLPNAEFAQLRAMLLGRSAPAREMVQGGTITRRIALDAAYCTAVPSVRHLLSSPRWRGLMRYVGSYASEPLYYIQTILTHRDEEVDPQTHLHADTFHPCVKAWYFLDDVTEEDGPFVYVPGSHRLTRERIEWERERSLQGAQAMDRLSARGSMRITRAEISALGLPGPRALAVPANTLVVADTGRFHARGPATRPSRRVEIWAYGRRNPFYPWTGLDPLSLPGIAFRRIPLMWALRDRFESRLGQPWRDVGSKTPLDP